MSFYEHIDLWAPLPVLGDGELERLDRECASFLQARTSSGDLRHIRDSARPADVRAAQEAVRRELHARGIGAEPWWCDAARPSAERRPLREAPLRLDESRRSPIIPGAAPARTYPHGPRPRL